MWKNIKKSPVFRSQMEGLFLFFLTLPIYPPFSHQFSLDSYLKSPVFLIVLAVSNNNFSKT